jgi:hypothetical protein
MSETSINLANIALILHKDSSQAQKYLIYGCSQINKDIIEVALSFKADLTSSDANGKTPISILYHAEKDRNSRK